MNSNNEVITRKLIRNKLRALNNQQVIFTFTERIKHLKTKRKNGEVTTYSIGATVTYKDPILHVLNTVKSEKKLSNGKVLDTSKGFKV